MNSKILVEFSERMDGSTINIDTFTLSDGVTGTVTYSGTTAEFIPSNNLNSNTTYTATITTGVKSIAGNPLQATYIWRFTTNSGNSAPTDSGNSISVIPASIEIMPAVLSTSPANNATGVVVNSAITAEFSDMMDGTTFTSNTFTLNGGVTGTVSYSGTTATFTPSSNLAYNTSYIATITTGVRDIDGNAMEANYSWSFTTTIAPVSTTITLTWDAPIENVDETPLDDLLGYKVYFRKTSQGYEFQEEIPLENTNLTCMVVSSPDSTKCTYAIPSASFSTGESYYFAITAYNSNGESNFSNEVLKTVQ